MTNGEKKTWSMTLGETIQITCEWEECNDSICNGECDVTFGNKERESTRDQINNPLDSIQVVMLIIVLVIMLDKLLASICNGQTPRTARRCARNCPTNNAHGHNSVSKKVAAGT